MTTTASGVRDAANHYTSLGWTAIRLHGVDEDGVCTCAKGIQPAHRGNAGKHPTEARWQDAQPPTPEQVQEQWPDEGFRSNCNIGVATGAPSGFFVLDVDPDAGGAESMAKLVALHGAPPRTLMQRTGSGGYHLLFQMPADFEPTNRYGGLKEYPGLDIRGTGGQIVVAPSVSAKGSYAWVDETKVENILPAPDWLLDMLRPVERATTGPAVVPAPTGPVVDLPATPEQGRHEAYVRSAVGALLQRLDAMAAAAADDYRGEPWNQTTFNVACSLLELANSPWTAYDAAQAGADLLAHAPRDAGFGDEELYKIMDSAVAKVGGQARPEPVERSGGMEMLQDWAEELGTADPLVYAATGGAPPSVVLERRTDSTVLYPQRTWDDMGNAMRIVDHFGRQVRYVSEMGSWAIFADGRWATAPASVVQGQVQRMIDELVPELEGPAYGDELEKPDDTETPRERFGKWLKAQRMAARVEAALKMGSGRPELHVSYGQFDSHKFAFNVSNGVVDLTDGTLHSADPNLLMMKQSPVAYDPAATCPRWESFLERVQPDPAMREYLQRILGYSITGAVREQAFFLHHGDGANGKSVMTDVMSALVGDYGAVVAANTLLMSAQETHPTGLAMMAGRRWLPATETARGKRLDEERIKNVTGDRTVTARFMGKDFFDFEPTGKIHLITNHLPHLSDAKSIWRRIHLVKWGVSIPEAEQDLNLVDRLVAEELPGILTWLVRGAIAWQARGLEMAEAARVDLAEYRADADSFGHFLAECTLPAEPETWALTTTLYTAYQAWAFRSGLKPMSLPSFSNALDERGLLRFRNGPLRGYRGLLVVAPAPVVLPTPVASYDWDAAASTL